MIQIDMEMPEKCSECEFEYDLYGQDGLIHGCYIQGIGETDAVRKTGRLPSCPLIDVPDMNVGNMVNEQPEIIYCKECVYSHMTYDGDCKNRDKWEEKYDSGKSLYLKGDFFCGFGERKTDD